MITSIVTPPAAEPVLIAALKSHMNIDSSFTDDDSYIETLQVVARRHVENITRRKLITQTWKLFLQGWPPENYITLPFGQLQSVAHLKYTDSNEDQSTFDSDDYSVDTDSDPGRVVLDYGKSWDGGTLWPLNPLELQFVTGYGAAGSDVPDEILMAIKLLVSELYERREMNIVGVGVQLLDMLSNLLASYRLWY